jgi:protein TonB
MLALVCLQFVKKDSIKHHSFIIPEPKVAIIDLKPAPKPPVSEPAMKKPVTPKPATATIKNFMPRIVADTFKIDPTPTLKDLETHVTADSTTDGPPGSGATVSAPASGSIAAGNGEGKDNSEAEPKIVAAPDVAPEFPGGVDGWVRFLKKNLRPKESDETYNVRVVVNFLVNEEGTISELRIIQSGGTDFDNEVLRVMRKSPKWNAGIYQGHKVKVYHSQPVIFMNQSDE